ncbi:MAG: HNH endonuclease signature motif containing protein [Breznakibacter sp.]
MQDESEGAKILIEKSDKFVGILERIRCAYKTNQTFDYDKPLGFVNGVLRHEGITLGDGHTYQEISLVMKDDVIACDPRNVSIDKKTNFYNFLFRGFSINVVGATDGQQLEKYLFDTSEAEYSTQQAKAIVKLHNELSKPTPDVDAATSLLYGLSDCALQQLTSTIREKSLALLLDGAGAYLPKWNERIIISLIRSALYDKGKAKSLYDCLCQKPALLYGLYDRTSVLRGEFIEALTLLCAQNWTQEQLDGLSADRYYITGSKELTLRSRFNDSKALDIWQLWANDNFKKSNSCNGIPPLSPVGLGDDCSSCSAGDIAYMPAIYVQSLTDAADVRSIKALANAALTFAGATGSVNLLLNSSRLVKTLGVIELANLTADGVLANPLVRARLAQTENGKSFLQVWPYVNMGIDLATVSTDILVNFVNSGRKAAAVLDELPANNVANRLDEAEEVLRKRGVATAGAEIVGSYDWGLVKRYFQHIQEVTGRPVPQVQIDKLKEALRAKEYKRLSQEATEAHRIEFNKKRVVLISEWEAKTGQTWPCYADDIYEDGKKVATKGHRYDAHHIIENKYGGENEWWNIHPAARPKEHQRLIHGEGSPALELFKD